MSENLFQLDSNLMAKQYVYYERLNDSENQARRQLYANALSSFNKSLSMLNSKESITNTINHLKRQAKAERDKEIRLLYKLYQGRNSGKELSNAWGKKWGDPENTKGFINAFNYFWGLKDIFERHKQIFTNPNKNLKTGFVKGMYSYFEGYLEKAFQEYEIDFDMAVTRFKQDLTGDLDKDKKVEKDFDEDIDSIFIKIIKKAWNLTFTAGTEAGVDSEDEKVRKAYYEFLTYLDNPPLDAFGRSIIDNILEGFKINDFKNQLKDSLKAERLFDKGKNFKQFSQMIRKNQKAHSGTMLEIVEGLIGTAMHKNIPEVYGGVMGDFGFKADAVYTVGIDISKAKEQIFDKIKNSDLNGLDRAKNIQFFNELEATLEGLDDGALIYTSDKNYTVDGKEFKKLGGFNASATLNLENYQNFVLAKQANPHAAAAAIGAILQLTKGAIGEGRQQEFERLLAKDIAYMLFDDFNTIGSDTAKGHPDSIHIMFLDGIYVPLSTILYRLAAAMESTLKENSSSTVAQVVKVDIDRIPTIEFENDKELREWQEKNALSNPWVYQRDKALDNFHFALHFLKDFSTLIKEVKNGKF